MLAYNYFKKFFQTGISLSAVSGENDDHHQTLTLTLTLFTTLTINSCVVYNPWHFGSVFNHFQTQSHYISICSKHTKIMTISVQSLLPCLFSAFRFNRWEVAAMVDELADDLISVQRAGSLPPMLQVTVSDHICVDISATHVGCSWTAFSHCIHH